ncbi:cysteinyl-tRNA synthetase [Pontibacter ummariensis]|uniref:Cysteine--tRNA ligase n=1 Tax=Pontibacter ummariensis TaxID=1610492 RepID=A0A239HTJ0_9BACT|nr:cysteine--tRNA ligase [Pontibacter ummariensis]PRY10409.1 cysteinyl-tRNA synthetase [Pontibacter ummariensis]SNS84123.1 cysteinyl-tRNA synthetase [Pontibacter ummariensis]
MQQKLNLYNTLTRKKEAFEPLHAPFVGMYVCGPTVYGEPHLGHARSAVTFDVLYRYLKYQGYKVRYVRNITDVGHLENDADEGEDKIQKRAKLEHLEPMEVVQHYTNIYHVEMEKLNVLPPDIEPRASGHIIEQIQMTQEILDNGLAYEVNGSVYFNVEAYNKNHNYGKLSGRNIEDLLGNTRTLDGQEEKRSPFDFALWKKASVTHIMRWPSPWSDGFPGWHLECSAMSRKYLGDTFDIHGGGLDLMFPHHECEIAQNQASCNHSDGPRYWVHNNMITVNGQKMGKSLGNFINLSELFSGKHDMLEQAYSPMTIRFFILQAHYRSTLDFSNEALQAARKGYTKLMNGLNVLKKLKYPEEGIAEPDQKLNEDLLKLAEDCYRGMNDDLNTARTIASLFNLLKKINSLYLGQLKIETVSRGTFDTVRNTYQELVLNVLGLEEEETGNRDEMLGMVLAFYKEAKEAKDYDKVDAIRAGLKRQGIVIKDLKTGVDWAYEE